MHKIPITMPDQKIIIFIVNYYLVQCSYLSAELTVESFATAPISSEEWGWTAIGSSLTTGDVLHINEDNNESASVLVDETKFEEPPRSDCRFPSRNSLLNIESVELDPPLRYRLLRCTLSLVKENR